MWSAVAVGAICLCVGLVLVALIGWGLLRTRGDLAGPEAVGVALRLRPTRFPPDPRTWFVGERHGRPVALGYVIDAVGRRGSRFVTGGMLRAVVAVRAKPEGAARAWPGPGPASSRLDPLGGGLLPRALGEVEGWGVGWGAPSTCRFGTVPRDLAPGWAALLWVEAPGRSTDPSTGEAILAEAGRLAEALDD